MAQRPTPAWARYGGAVLAIAVATVLRFGLDPVLGGAGFALFLAGVVIASWLGGLGPSLLALALSVVVSAVFFGPPSDADPEPFARVITGLAVFCFVGIVTALLSESMRAAQKKAQLRADEAVLQREQLRTTLSCIGDAVIVTDKAGGITLMNPVAERLTGYSTDESARRSLEHVFCVSNEGTGERVKFSDANGWSSGLVEALSKPLVLTSKDGRPCPIDCSAAEIRGNELRGSGVVLIFRDATQRRRAEQNLLEAARHKDEFLALLAHELRNPLAPIGNALQILRATRGDAKLVEESRTLMQRQFEHLVRLVDDLLDVSRIARGKIDLRLEHTTLQAVLPRAIEAARPVIEGQGHSFSANVPDEPIPIHADPVRLAQIITNLLTNAARYTDPGGSIAVAARCEGPNMVLSVRDSGIGIAREQLPEIFDMFMQADHGLARVHGGLGIGLTLVKSLVQLHDGAVEAKSAGLGHGSEFTIRLPLDSQEPQLDPGPGDHGTIPLAHPRKILVVDDNIDAANSLACLLQSQGHDVQVAHDGPAALQKADIIHPEIVILDLGMPRMDGYQVAESLRARPEGRSMILVALTGWGGEDAREKTQLAGFNYHLVKPARLEDLERVAAQDPRATLTDGPWQASSADRG